ncbi:MAG: amino acid adenylation domain-containing protein [Candidatus Latescibacteria bacterium]|nr:amino acid adenylation domain-containing protein [Candidatus Latescibacterota bacterium]
MDMTQTRLSYTQESIWFLDRLFPGKVPNNRTSVWRIQGDLHEEALRSALGEMVHRHEILRTSYPTDDALPVARVELSVTLPLTLIDLSDLTAPKREAAILVQTRRDRSHTFDIGQAPLYRISLIRSSGAEHVLILTMHQIICDASSVQVFCKDLADLYVAFCQCESVPASEPSRQYREFVARERKSFQDELSERSRSYWLARLGRDIPVLELPTDRPRPKRHTHEYEVQDLSMYRSDTEALRDLGERESCSVFVILASLLNVLLYRYTDMEEVVIGTPVATRGDGDSTRSIGVFLNVCVLKVSLSGEMLFTDLIHGVKGTVDAAFEHKHLPFDRLVEDLKIERHAGRNPLFQVMLELTDTPILELTGSKTIHEATEWDSVAMDLSLRFMWEPEGLTGSLVFNSDLFDVSTIGRMAGHFRTLLDAVIADPARPISQLPLLLGEEHEQLLTWNQTAAKYPQNLLLHQPFEQQVEKTPDAVALVYQEATLSYRELNHHSNLLAGFLKTKGVGPGALVGLCAERSFEMVIALYAILKAGAAYVPLDPVYPRDRLEAMLEDARISLTLVQDRFTHLVSGREMEIISLDCLLDSGNPLIPEEISDMNPDIPTNPESLAYVLFTSGSTGRPKGVMVSHGAILNRLFWGQSCYPLTEKDALLQKTPYSFDVSVPEFFHPLLAGARMIIAEPDGHRDGAYLIDLIRKHHVTSVHFVPSMLQIFLENSGAHSCTSIRRVTCSGEALSYDLQERFFSVMSADLLNLYGPTEAAVEVTYWDCVRESGRTDVPIGYPVANTSLYILDKSMNPVPVGVPGELHIGGVQVAQGYINRPELTEERFVRDPFSEDSNARMYKTGDLCRFLADGCVEYLGRNDFQVKIRGFRIELGEIEAVLLQHESVREAVLLAREDTPGDLRLVAYVTQITNEIDAEIMRAYLAPKLPDYMVPSAFVMMESLPLTESGKTNLRALPAPDYGAQSSADYMAPRGDVEEAIAEIWEETLQIGQVGIRDNFFEIGGNSLIAVRLFAKINDRFGVDLPLAAIFEAPNIEESSKLIGNLIVSESSSDVQTSDMRELDNSTTGEPSNSALTTGEWTPLVALQAKGSRLPFFCMHGAGGNVLNFHLLSTKLGEDQPFFGLQAQGVDGKLPPLESIEQMAEIYIDAVKTVQPEGPYLLGGYSGGGIVALDMARQLAGKGEEIGLLVFLDTFAPRLPKRSYTVGEKLRLLWDLGIQGWLRLRLDIEIERFKRYQVWNNLRKGKPVPLQLRETYLMNSFVQTQVKYDPKDPYLGPIHLLTAERVNVIHEHVAHDLGWSHMPTGEITVHRVPGGHDDLVLEPNVNVLVDHMRRCLDAAQP